MKILSRQYFQTYWLKISHLLLLISLKHMIHVQSERYVVQHDEHIRHRYASQQQVDGVLPHVLHIYLIFTVIDGSYWDKSKSVYFVSRDVERHDIYVKTRWHDLALPCEREPGCWRGWRWFREHRWWQPGSRGSCRKTATSKSLFPFKIFRNKTLNDCGNWLRFLWHKPSLGKETQNSRNICKDGILMHL